MRCTAVRWDGPRWVLGAPGATWLVGHRPGGKREVVSLPVAATVWATWRRRNLLATLFVVVGIGLIAGGIGRADGALIGVGVTVVVLAAAYRTRAHRNFWTTCVLAAHADLVIVEPTHPDFDRQARELFTRSIDHSYVK